MYRRISTREARELIATKEPLLLDVRDAGAYRRSHITGALLFSDLNPLELRRSLPRDRPLLVYCYHGIASQDIAQMFADFGFGEVYSLDGGFEAWHADTAQGQTLADPLAAWLRDHGFEPGEPNCQAGETWPLIKACQMGRADVVEALAAAGADLTVTDAYGNDALWAACYSGDLPTIAAVLDAGVDPDRRNPSGATALIFAASSGRTEVVSLLLDRGADPGIRTEDDFTALDLAANIEILYLLRRAQRRESHA
ncbi:MULTISPECIES: ankyrin repeat domain-containing protein [Methylococcus]|uniref:Ankyrin repeat domain-containing protein n=1 Tax=Methylococcus capsulatus TaxID=414 RepID=A0ABZ2F6Y9_METCP|nr:MULTISPECIES: ankyrin repeat domain-containing protein [Methylococcus]MDF9392513.1 rhodanese [Methylococcus capsulatus]